MPYFVCSYCMFHLLHARSVLPQWYTHTHARTHAYTHAHMHAHTTHAYTCVYAHTHTHMHTHIHTHTHTVQLSSTQPSDTFFEGYLVEARESTSDGFATNTSIWGTWSVNRSDPYHTVNCNRSSTSQEGPFPVSTLAARPVSNAHLVMLHARMYSIKLDHLFY